MSALNSAQFEQDVQNTGVSAMDTTPISQAVDPAFLSTIVSQPHPDPTLPSQLIQPSPIYIDKPDPTSAILTSMHVSMPDLTSPTFISSMDALDAVAPSIHTAPAAFVGDFSHPDPFAMVQNSMSLELSPTNHTLSASPPQSQIPSPAMHGSTSSYPVGVTSSLESALDPTGVSTGRSRASTSVSPPANPSLFSQAPISTQQSVSMTFAESAPSARELADLLPSSEQHRVLVPLLKQIAQTAESAGYALWNHDGASASSKVDELKASISKVSEMLDRLTVSRSDQSRKRCATELDEGRNVKALKREPQEDLPLSLPHIDPSLPVPAEQSPTYPTPLSAHPLGSVVRPILPLPHSHSQPPSRAPTPPKASLPSRPSFSPSKSNAGPSFPAFMPSSPTLEFPPKIAPPLGSPSAFGVPTTPGASPWNDPIVSTSRHHHSLSAGAITSPLQTIPITPGGNPAMTGPLDAFSPNIPTVPPPMLSPSTSTISPPIGRMSRSGSITGVSYSNGFSFNYPPKETPTWGAVSQHAQNLPPTPQTRSQSQSNWYFGPSEHTAHSASPSTSDVSSTMAGAAANTTRSSPTDPDENDDDHDSDASDGQYRTSNKKTSGDSHGPGASSSDVPIEYRAEVDRIFFEYLNKICSNRMCSAPRATAVTLSSLLFLVDATDSKGEPIHQTLMAKKMQRLDESPDFRPFKFRIQAFTLAFLEELARQGYPEEKIPMKKIRNYLWRQPHILRFNEDGKKAKSKGNHIWNIEAKKAGDGKWEFRPFHRRLAGTPPSVAYCGLRWSWTPRIWDPQASWQNVPVTYTSPNLPSWLSWKDDVLSGIPPPDAENCIITVDAKFVIDGQEGHLTHTFNVTIAPVSSIDTTSFSRSRRPSLAGEPPKRSTSDSALFQAPQRAKTRAMPAPVESADTRVIRVLQSAAQRVTQEAESQLVSASPPRNDLQDLVKQKHVLDQTVDAYDRALSGQGRNETNILAVAAQNVVVQAAHKVYADRGGGVPPHQSEAAIQSITVGELSEVTQDAIAKAVKRHGTASTEVDIVVTAAGIIKSESDAVSAAVAQVGVQPIPQQIRSLSTGTLPARMNPPLINGYPNNLSPLPEYS
ncbi:hypothetical protein P691DRAFT_806814 [Macrolepiota fuliginosa MF-IS2]|uniref:Uncharacterized protein n=1 Tax=Macrolepiota fuliginosa MF-IS2 TaxID=1400762 RepID=A0A9P5XQG5_9AGAR|nr:hypothetical protein P691DRAFT_806814 [Macrolepiota fuliginosa MF-IS2]